MANIHFDCENCGETDQALFDIQEYDGSRLYEGCHVKTSIKDNLDISIEIEDLKEATCHVKNLDHLLFLDKLIKYIKNNKEDIFFVCNNCSNGVVISAYCEGCGIYTENLKSFLCEGCLAYREHQQ